MFEITFTIDGIETKRNVRANTEQQAVSVIQGEFPDACIVRINGPWLTA